MFILGQFRGSPGKKFCGFIASIRVKQTLQERKESCFIPTVRVKLLKNTLIFRPVLEHQWAHNQAVTHQRKRFSPLVHRRSQRSFLITGDWATPYPNRWYGDYRHTKRKRNWLPYQLNAIQIWGDSFQTPPRKLYVTYILYKAHSFWREFGMNTSKVFTLLIKYTFAPSIWQKSTLSQTFYPIV